MPDDDSKAPVKARPLARWALATLAADAALVAALVALPRPIVLDAPLALAPHGRPVMAVALDDRAAFLWRDPHREDVVAVLIELGRPARSIALSSANARRIPLSSDALSDPCSLLEVLAWPHRERCDTAPAPRPVESTPTSSSTRSPGQESRVTLRWWRAETGGWSRHDTALLSSEGAEALGDRSVRAQVDGLELSSRRGFRVTRPWITIGGERRNVDRDVRVEHALVLRDGRRSQRWLATAEGIMIPLDHPPPRRSVVETLAGMLGPEAALAALVAWLTAQVTALAAARTTGAASVFSLRFLRWSAMLGVFVTGAMALALLHLAKSAS
jgi:hypothetical protein